jgi:hypothetical protein
MYPQKIHFPDLYKKTSYFEWDARQVNFLKKVGVSEIAPETRRAKKKARGVLFVR